ncbi:NAD(P)/FAD-dependent oxidoreductase [Marinobacter sediminum]|uniref:flavin-containing monooxygenase n=1 Tax=Marinobacter sediminum TaxID=256323 RepID=UPI00202E796E|nr:NAD(P)/FAD-dependent oxidoreductase [Marinobacter sediminum]MCM0612409.1 NAD(P)/FAD-dependent oxidoreductase [Marinobacter sediminum]
MQANQSNDLSRQQVTIIGAGTSGLSLAYFLKRRGISPVILEAAETAGSSWSRRHKQLRLNTHRRRSSLPGQSLPRRLGTFVHRDDYVEYVKHYADWLAHRHCIEIRHGVAVQRIDQTPNGWTLGTSEGTVNTRQLVVATGPERITYIPAWPGLDSCSMEKRHAADFGDINDYSWKRVLIVGGANSGIDIANWLARHGRCNSLAISMRQGTHLLPTRLFGISTQLTAPLLGGLPLHVQDWIGALMSKLSFGDLTRWGIRTPDMGVCTRLAREGTAPGFDDGFVAAVKRGEVQVLPDVRRFTAHRVEFTDGSNLVCDTVIFATGYRTGLPALLNVTSVLDERGRPKVDAPDADERYPGLWFFGMRPRLEGNIYARVKEARQLARVLAKQHA